MFSLVCFMVLRDLTLKSSVVYADILGLVSDVDRLLLKVWMDFHALSELDSVQALASRLCHRDFMASHNARSLVGRVAYLRWAKRMQMTCAITDLMLANGSIAPNFKADAELKPPLPEILLSEASEVEGEGEGVRVGIIEQDPAMLEVCEGGVRVRL